MQKVGTVTNTADDNGEFTDGHAAAGIKPTLLLAGWHNTIQRELAAIVEGAGEELDPNDDEQISKIIGQMSAVINHYRNYGYPEWESAIPYYEGAVVYYNGDLYLSLLDNNIAQVPGTDDSKWQPYIQRESTEEEAIAGEGSTQVITPRRLHAGASYLDEQLKAALTPYLLPVGAIVLWGSETPPDGWLELNGQEFDTEDNPKLALIYPSGVVPDYRGRFVRAWSNGSTIDADRELGSYQDDEIKSHKHAITMSHEHQGATDGEGFPQTDASGPNITHAETEDDGTFPRRNGTGNPLFSFGGDETRPINISAMYIIKSDLAESENSGSTTPTALVISPSTVTVNAGATRQFTGTVLPAALADGYPVSWSVSDSSLGSIDSDGMYTATAGKSGTQTIIANLSTGLTATATVTQRIYLTAIAITNAPTSLVAGDAGSATVAYSPSNYTESVYSSSSDSTIAVIDTDGAITSYAAGTVTLSITGASSGVTASITITVTEEVVPEVYLQIENKLSEIAAAGATAQSEARDALDLGELATKDSLTADDVNAVPQATESLGTADLNTVLTPGRKFQSLTSNATTARNYPVALAGMLDVIKTTSSGIRQMYAPYNNTDVYHRYCVDVGANPVVFGSWEQSGGDFLAVENNLSDVADAAESRENLGVSYTISTDAAPTDASGYAAGHMWYQTEA